MTDTLAFHGPVRVLSWSESSAQEFKVKLELLDGRDALAHFEKATRRRGKKAGQRYRAVWQNAEGEAIEGPDELWLAGANWAHQTGATVAFTPDAEGVAWIRMQLTADVAPELARKLYLALVQIDDDERPLNQAQAELVEFARELAGGPHSKAAAIRCTDPEFRMYVAQRQRLAKPATLEQCDAYIKQQCGIHTKKLLDHAHPTSGEPFWDRYLRNVQTPFLNWSQSRAARTVPSGE